MGARGDCPRRGPWARACRRAPPTARTRTRRGSASRPFWKRSGVPLDFAARRRVGLRGATRGPLLERLSSLRACGVFVGLKFLRDHRLRLGLDAFLSLGVGLRRGGGQRWGNHVPPLRGRSPFCDPWSRITDTCSWRRRWSGHFRSSSSAAATSRRFEVMENRLLEQKAQGTRRISAKRSDSSACRTRVEARNTPICTWPSSPDSL